MPQDLTPEKKDLIHRVVLLSEEYHQDTKLALSIIKCESNFDFALHKNKNGTIDSGFWQINSTHRKEALARGFDISDPYQNLEFGMAMLKENGTSPWVSSSVCWGPKVT